MNHSYTQAELKFATDLAEVLRQHRVQIKETYDPNAPERGFVTNLSSMAFTGDDINLNLHQIIKLTCPLS